MGDNASSFSITELDGQKRSLSLTGRALPHRPLALTGTMRAEFTYYPGNPIGTVQVLGPAENDTTISGVWKDRFLRSTDDEGNRLIAEGQALLSDERGAYKQIADVESLVNEVDDIRLQGQLLRVTWDTRVRVGILKEFKQTWQRHEICEWEMVFGWISRGEKDLPVNFASQGNLSKKNADLLTRLDSFIAAAQNFEAMVASYKAEVFHYVDLVQTYVESINDIAASANANVLTSLDAARMTVAAYGSIKSACNDLVATVQSLPPTSIMEATAQSIDAGLGEVLGNAGFQRGLVDEARALRDFAAQQADDLASTLDEQEIEQVFEARQDSDLRDVATLFYGSPDEWKRLADFNGLTGSRLTAGMEILVPRLKAGGRAPT